MRKKKSKFASNNAITKCRKEKNRIAIRELNPTIDEIQVRGWGGELWLYQCHAPMDSIFRTFNVSADSILISLIIVCWLKNRAGLFGFGEE